MTYTALLKALLARAEEIQKEYLCDTLCASHIAAAVADLCRTPYTGIPLAQDSYAPVRFEEERLRYLFAKEIKLASYFRTCLARHRRNGMDEPPFDPSVCAAQMALRHAEVLSADLAFVCVLQHLPDPYKATLRHAPTEEWATACLEDADQKIYDYVVDSITKVCDTLQQKARTAAAIRDWKPAAKFTEPETLAARFAEQIAVDVEETSVTLRLVRFFGSTDLKLTICRVGEIYYIHDNGCTLRHLTRQVSDPQKRARILKKVCHPCWLDGKRVTGHFTNSFRFLYYLQMLVFIAHGDLYYTRAEEVLYTGEPGYRFPDAAQVQPIETAPLSDMLRPCIQFAYNPNIGLYCWLDTHYGHSSGRAAFTIQAADGGRLCLRDKNRGQDEGEIFEGFYWRQEDLTPYAPHIIGIAARFGADFDGRELSLTAPAAHVQKALFRFFNLAVLFSEFGQRIALPKTRHKR